MEVKVQETVMFTVGRGSEKIFQETMLKLVTQGYRFAGTTTFRNSSGLVREVLVRFFKPGR